MRRPIGIAIVALALAACSGTPDATTTTEAGGPATTTASAPTTTAATPTTAPGGEASSDTVVFVAGPGTSVRFEVWEVLLGVDTLVVGATDAVFVDATVDFADPAATVIGPVVIEAGTLETDQSRRNGAIHQFILQTSAHPQVVFTPTDLGDIAAALDGGATTVTGDLRIRDVSVPVAFDVEVASADASGIVATATATVDRTDWDLTIPSVASVAGVDDEVLLVLDLVLVPAP